MADASSPMQLITEDEDLRQAFISLMRRHVQDWPAVGVATAPVYVRRADGADNALTQISTVWKTDKLRCLGVVVDADDKFPSRWARIKRFSKLHFLPVPDKLPPEGLILTTADGKKFGAWVMPDNKSPGMLETFCHPLIPDRHKPLWEYAANAAQQAKGQGAEYIDQHAEKAHIHTYLAWNNPPGQSIGRALASGCLDCCAHDAMAFVSWTKALYSL
jgi:hypothetical protein